MTDWPESESTVVRDGGKGKGERREEGEREKEGGKREKRGKREGRYRDFKGKHSNGSLLSPIGKGVHSNLPTHVPHKHTRMRL